MMFRTHVLFGIFCALFVLGLYNIEDGALFFGIFVLCSMLPDMDLPRSRIGGRHKVISSLLNVVFGHRGFIHTLFPALGLFALFYSFGSLILGIAAFLGYMSHLILDMLTPEGVRLLYPFWDKGFRGFIRTSGFLEYMFFIVLIVAVVFQIRSLLP